MTSFPSHMVVVRLSAMGDVALTTGPLSRWHEACGMTFTVLTRAAFTPLFTGHPAVRRLIGLEKEQLHGSALCGIFRALAEEFPKTPLVDLHGVARARLLSLLWKGPVYRYPKQALTRRLFLLSGGRLGRDVLLARNVPQRYAAALAPLVPQSLAWTPEELRPRFFLSAEEVLQGREALAPLLAPSSSGHVPLVALHPFATHPSKAWPTQRWREFSRLLEARNIPHFWIGQGEAALAPAKQDTPSSSLNFINRTDLRQLIALLAQASVLITGDSGPMHLADGVDTPVLALFGPTCREWGFFPSGTEDRVIQRTLGCRPCSLHGGGKKDDFRICAHEHACMDGLTPERILRELDDMPLSLRFHGQSVKP